MGSYGSENFKMLLLLQIATESFQTCPEFFSQWFSQNYIRDFWKFDFPIFNDFFWNFLNPPLYSREKSNPSIFWKARDRRTKSSDIWDSHAVI